MEAAQDAAAPAEEQHAKQPIEFPAAEEPEHEASRLDEERAKHRARAEKFGTEYVDPSQRRDMRLDARKERFNRPGFATGIDLFTEEEQQKREQRAARFGLPAGSGLEWKPPQVDEDAEKRRARAERFGVEYRPKDETGLMDVDLFEARRDPGAMVPRRPEAVHVYGVDLMSTGDLLKYFADYGPKFVEWINDSSANVLFADGPTAKRAVAGMGKPLPPEEAPEQMGIDPSDPAAIEFLWHKGEDFVKAGTPIPLIFRVATVEDVKPSERVPSRRLWLSAGGGRQRGGRQRQQQQEEWQEEGGEEGGEYQERGRGRRRYKVRRGGRPSGWQHDDRGEEGQGGEGQGGGQGWGDLDAVIQQQRQQGGEGGGGGGRRQRRPRGKRQRRDVDMEDAEGGGMPDYGNEPQRFRRDEDDEPAAAAAPTALAGPPREQVDYTDL
ncbi:splicing RNP complex component [Chlorella sorokiniana]|uniref:Splicing RNP complex component n=1 Tax=Chlorella sorokiniana TaxID=3076 RepID=A0A2P6TWE2_CHLSO|nr:splicing RNP complex component [Chlorella sorokiniana]|eukprot:PRW58378.1 splicing RNP complex component [Chlorella sorokiniana]